MISLSTRFLEQLRREGVEFSQGADGAASIPARHPAVGDIRIVFDGGEITVCVGKITHDHFTPGVDGKLGSADPDGEAVECAVEYLLEILSDRRVIWSVPGVAGGCFLKSEIVELPMPDAGLFLWSGPIAPDRGA